MFIQPFGKLSLLGHKWAMSIVGKIHVLAIILNGTFCLSNSFNLPMAILYVSVNLKFIIVQRICKLEFH